MSNTAAVRIEITGQRALARAMKAVGDTDAPFLNHALLESADDAAGETRSRGPGSIGSAVSIVGLRGSGISKRAVVSVKHPGAASMEFGRTLYYAGYTGRKQKSGYKRKVSKGQQAKPFIGVVKGDAAMGASRDRIVMRIMHAFELEWERLGGVD